MEVPLGELSGELTMTTGPACVNFKCDGDSLHALTEAPEPEESDEEDGSSWTFAPRSLDLILDPSFLGLEAIEDDVPRLFLPENAGHFRYLEVAVKLTVQGACEADFQDNDVLDVTISLVPRPLYPFSV